MKILLVEESSAAMDCLIRDLRAVTAASIEHANTFDVGLRKIMLGHGSIDIVLFTIGAPEDAVQFPRQVRMMTAKAVIRCPLFVALSASPLPLPCARMCMDRQIVYLLREYPGQVVEIVKVLLSKLRCPKKPWPAIRIEFLGQHYKFSLCGPTSSEDILVSNQIGRLLRLLLVSGCTVETVADRLGIGVRSVKQYMRTLRLILKCLLEQMDMNEPPGGLVWVRRESGGTVCGIRANPLWE